MVQDDCRTISDLLRAEETREIIHRETGYPVRIRRPFSPIFVYGFTYLKQVENITYGYEDTVLDHVPPWTDAELRLVLPYHDQISYHLPTTETKDILPGIHYIGIQESFRSKGIGIRTVLALIARHGPVKRVRSRLESTNGAIRRLPCVREDDRACWDPHPVV